MGLRVVIAGGGTGGHLFPGIAVARELLARRPGTEVSFAGTARGIEARVLPREGFELDLIRSGGIKGKSIAGRARGASLLPASVWDAWNIVARRRPHLVIGVGGYSSGPVVLTAALRGVPTMVLEQNAVPGLTNRLLAPFVRAAAVTFDSTRRYFRGKAFVSGNPVRPEFLESVGPLTGAGADEQSSIASILVFGGSQGAHAINVAMVEAAPELAADPHLRLTHQTGERDVEMVRAAYRHAGISAEVEPFLFDMGAAAAARRRDCLPRGRDDAGRDHGGGQGGDSDSAADRDRRSPAEERGGPGGDRGRRVAAAERGHRKRPCAARAGAGRRPGGADADGTGRSRAGQAGRGEGHRRQA